MKPEVVPEILAGGRSGDGWVLTWTTRLLDDDGRWWWQVMAKRESTLSPASVSTSRRRYEGAPVGPPEKGWSRIECADGTFGDVKEGEFLFLDGGTLDFGAGMGSIWEGPCESREGALEAVQRFLAVFGNVDDWPGVEIVDVS